MQRAGFDGVQIHMAHGCLISQFLTPHTNRRTDEYGGLFDNRMRFAREVLAAVREHVGPDFAVIAKINGHDKLAMRDGLDTASRKPLMSTVEYPPISRIVSPDNGFRGFRYGGIRRLSWPGVSQRSGPRTERARSACGRICVRSLASSGSNGRCCARAPMHENTVMVLTPRRCTADAAPKILGQSINEYRGPHRSQPHPSAELKPKALTRPCPITIIGFGITKIVRELCCNVIQKSPWELSY